MPNDNQNPRYVDGGPPLEYSAGSRSATEYRLQNSDSTALPKTSREPSLPCEPLAGSFVISEVADDLDRRGSPGPYYSEMPLPGPHVDQHSEARLTIPELLCCDVEGCGRNFTGRYRQGNLGRHKRLQHSTRGNYPCQFPECPKAFNRSDARLKHYRKTHSDIVSHPPVPRPVKPCFALDDFGDGSN